MANVDGVNWKSAWVTCASGPEPGVGVATADGVDEALAVGLGVAPEPPEEHAATKAKKSTNGVARPRTTGAYSGWWREQNTHAAQWTGGIQGSGSILTGCRPPTPSSSRRGRQLPPLRHLERLLSPGPGAGDDLFLRLLRVAGIDARAGPGRQARADLPQAAASPRRTDAGRGLRLGDARHPCGFPVRRVGGGRYVVAEAGRTGPEARGRGGGGRQGRDQAPGRAGRGRRALRRDHQRRDIRARRGRAAERLLPASACAPAAARAPAEPRHLAPAGQAVAVRAPRLHRSLRVPRRRVARLRGGGAPDPTLWVR